MNNKVCTKCHIEKELSEFYKDKSKKDGYRPDCKECKRKHYQENREYYNEKCREYKRKHKEQISEYNHRYAEVNKDKIKKRRYINKKIISIQQLSYINNKYKTNFKFRITHNLRARINQALKGKTKSLSTMFLLGCEIDYLMYHIQNQFTKGMSWDNYGLDGWVVDHIKPCCKFDFTKDEEQLKCFHYTNLQPLWAIDNYKKQGKY